MEFRRGDACAELDGGDLRAADALTISQRRHTGLYLTDAAKLLRPLADGLIEPALDGVFGIERLDPCGDGDIQLAERELVKDSLQDAAHRRVVERQAVDRQTRHVIP